MSAWTVIQHIELSSAQANITFSSIPQTYTDLICLVSANTTINDANLVYFFNGTTANHSVRNLLGVGSGNGISQSGTGALQWASSRVGTSNTFASGSIYIPNYTSANPKSTSTEGVSEENATGAYQILTAGLFNSSAAITQLTLQVSSGQNLIQNSSATLYGITRGSSGGVTVS